MSLCVVPSLLLRANMKVAKIQFKLIININLSSHVTFDGHSFHGKVAPWCPPTFDKVSQPCAYVNAYRQAPRGFWSVLAVKLYTLSQVFFKGSLAARQDVLYSSEHACVAHSQNQSVLHVPMHGKQPLRDAPFGKIHNQNHAFSLDSTATPTN